ncbi:DUF2164 domain-containing protein [Marinobacter fonticola]|uniref:DUF2164 domain-containing protein n=1 Tax=Marinobacter fonticola TaxID=2603215 RepID=UPI0011E6CE7E|nr:DUF2164 domain-containing protein [Marinobacter fonticola]
METFRFSDEEKSQVVQKVKRYFQQEMDQDIGGFDAEFLIDFFADEIGAYFYNRGLYDAQAVFTRKMHDLDDEVLALERPTEFSK